MEIYAGSAGFSPFERQKHEFTGPVWVGGSDLPAIDLQLLEPPGRSDLILNGAKELRFGVCQKNINMIALYIAKDWFSGLGLSLTHQGRLHFIQWHHIFPKSLLKQLDYDTGEINEIANMAFITGQTNRRISNKKPHEYLPDTVAAQGIVALESQSVPYTPELLQLENYRDFLQVRREALAKRMNDFISCGRRRENGGNRRFESIVVLVMKRPPRRSGGWFLGFLRCQSLGSSLVFHPIAWAFDQDGFSMMEESIQHG